MYVKKCIVCKETFETTNEYLRVCQDCQMDGSLDRMIEEQEAEEDQNRREHQAFREKYCDDNPPRDYDEEAFDQEQLDRDDNGPDSGWTDLGNPGGTTFCW